MIPPIILFFIILSFLVFIHELGHFWTARKFGVKVLEFGLGIPPRAWAKKVGETVYSLNWLPIGGFVRIKGEDFEDYDPKDTTNFINKHPWQKSVVLLAGVFMNFALAIALFYLVLGVNGWKSNPLVLMDDYQFAYGETRAIPNIIMVMSEDGPAAKAGFEFGDQILTLTYEEETVAITTIDDLRGFLEDKSGLDVVANTKNIASGELNTYTVVPEYREEIEQAALGVVLGEGVEIVYDQGTDKLFSGFLHSANIMQYSFHMLGSLFAMSVEERDIAPISEGVAGPIGIFGAVRAVMENGGDRVLITILDLTALLSLSLAIMNLLPIPALDGGRLVFVIYEWIVGKPASPMIENKAHQIGFGFLILLIIAITFKDIFQFIL